jgi:hypothetical protein
MGEDGPSPLVSEHDEHERQANVTVGTTKKSAATSDFQAGSRTIVASRCWSAADGFAVRPVCTGEI